MSGSVNKVIIVGHLGADPEIKSFATGGKVCNLRVATSESWTDRQSGQKRERTEWHNVVIRAEGLVGVAEKYLRKGEKAYFEGRLQTRKWQDQQGVDRYITEIVLTGPGAVLTLLGKGDGGRGAAGGGAASAPADDGFDSDGIPY